MYRSEYTRADHFLKKAKKTIKYGTSITVEDKEGLFDKKLEKINEVIEENNRHIKLRRNDRLETLKEVPGKICSALLEFIDEVFSESGDEITSENAEEKATEYFNKGYENDRISDYKKCYEIAKKFNLEDLKYDSAYNIAYLYYDYGIDENNKGIDEFNEELYDFAMQYFNNALDYYNKALEWSPSKELDEDINHSKSETMANLSEAEMSYYYDD